MTPEHEPKPRARGPEPESELEISLDDPNAVDLQALADEIASQSEDDLALEVVGGESEENEFSALMEEDSTKLQEQHQAFQAQLGSAKSQIEDMEKREAEIMDQFRRLAGDFTNFRNRVQRDTQLAVEQSERRMLLEILPVLDNFERGLEASYLDMEAFRGGIELIRKQLVDALRRLGAIPIDLKVGDPFDAQHAEALTTMQSPDLPDHAIAAIYERAYMLRDQLLRPARVVVNHAPPPFVMPPDAGGPATSGPAVSGPAVSGDAPGPDPTIQ
ncbi:MAG: nucleotide exchange factor GrpE [Holophagaceae bacterium]|nr:nucleotide exchange factor GrpE [Holophagaceae bacterium]